MYKVETIASFFINKANNVEIDEKVYEGISHLKLQKILYFSQAVFLVVKWESAFDEEIYAWKYGPVIEEIYETFSRERSKWNTPLSKEDILDKDFNTIIEVKDKKLLLDVWKEFGQYSANQLVQITHSHSPWKDAFNILDSMWWLSSWNKSIIEKSVIKNYYTGLIEIR